MSVRLHFPLANIRLPYKIKLVFILRCLMRRRDFIAFLGGALASPAIMPLQSVSAPLRPPLRVDVHCHFFNGRDLPIYGLLESVFIEQNIFGPLAEPLALWLAASVEGASPTYDDEIRDLDRLIKDPAAVAQRKSGRGAELLERGLDKVISDYTSLRGPKESPTQRGDTLLLDLMRRFAPPSALKEDMTKEDVGRLVNNPQFRKELIKRILEHRTRKDARIADEISDYISQFGHWVETFTSFHSQLAEDLANFYGEDEGDELRLMTPAIVDFGPWPQKFWYRDQLTPIDQQAVLSEKISLIRRKGRAIHGFIGFDPWRYLQEVQDGVSDNSFEVLKRAIEKRGFVGVKLYPPMGFQPFDNVRLPNAGFPDGLVQLCKGKPGEALDQVLAMVYDYCDRNELAIMAHCGNTIGSHPGYALRSAPELWKPVLDSYKRLRLNLGHFGGIWDFFYDPACRDSTDTSWPKTIGEMVDVYDNLFVDVGDFSGVLDRWDTERCATKDIFANLKHLLGKHPRLGSRIMYGSDWMLLDREPGNEDYYQKMKQRLADLLGAASVNGFLGQNAATYLGLRSGQPTRKRIDEFYRAAGQSAPNFDRYLVS